MKTSLLLMRHAIADDTSPDESRRLTEAGIEKLSHVLTILPHLLSPPQLILSSPLTRAHETATLLSTAFNNSKIKTTDALLPDASPNDTFLEFQTAAKQHQTLALVGHNPHLEFMVSYLISPSGLAGIEMKKSGVALITFRDQPHPGKGTLEWLFSPKVLRGKS
jgi:phosphohistidine phosphatase